MIGAVLLLVALSVAVVLGVVLAGAVMAKSREREQLLRQGGYDDEEIAEARRHRPPLKGWIVCSSVALVGLTVAGALAFKGCQALRRTLVQQERLQECRSGLGVVSTWFGDYWEKNRKLPAPDDPSMPSVYCPLGNQFVYIGHLGVMRGRYRVLLVEMQPHEDGTHHVLLGEESFIRAGQPVGPPPGMKVPPGMPPSAFGIYYNWLNVDALSDEQYQGIRNQANAAVEKTGK